MKFPAVLVLALLAALFAPRWLPQSERSSCCCPDGMLGACMRTEADCSLESCDPGGAAVAIASKVLLPPPPSLPPPERGELLASLDSPAKTLPPDDPSDPPPRV